MEPPQRSEEERPPQRTSPWQAHTRTDPEGAAGGHDISVCRQLGEVKGFLDGVGGPSPGITDQSCGTMGSVGPGRDSTDLARPG